MKITNRHINIVLGIVALALAVLCALSITHN